MEQVGLERPPLMQGLLEGELWPLCRCSLEPYLMKMGSKQGGPTR